jgi:hypothetical protein
MKTLQLVGWKTGLQSVSLVQAMKEYSTGSLVEAKRLLDELLDGREVILAFETDEQRAEFRRLAEKFGAVVS